MVQYDVVFSPRAQAQLIELDSYISNAAAPIIAERFITAIVDQCADRISILGIFYGGQDFRSALQLPRSE